MASPGESSGWPTSSKLHPQPLVTGHASSSAAVFHEKDSGETEHKSGQFSFLQFVKGSIAREIELSAVVSLAITPRPSYHLLLQLSLMKKHNQDCLLKLTPRLTCNLMCCVATFYRVTTSKCSHFKIMTDWTNTCTPSRWRSGLQPRERVHGHDRHTLQTLPRSGLKPNVCKVIHPFRFFRKCTQGWPLISFIPQYSWDQRL